MAISAVQCRLCRSSMRLDEVVFDVVHRGRIVEVRVPRAHYCQGCRHVIVYSDAIAQLAQRVALLSEAPRLGKA